MKLSIVRQVLADAWRAIRMNLLGSRRDHYEYIHPTATVLMPSIISKRNVRLYEHTNIGEHANIMANKGKFIMKKYSIAGPGLTVICQNHNMFEVGSYPGDKNWNKGEIPADVIVEDGVWLGANVTLCPGAHVSRGCIIAAGSVVTGNTPPYTIIGGVPARVIKKRFSIEEIMEHERRVLPEEERFSMGFLNEVFQSLEEIS